MTTRINVRDLRKIIYEVLSEAHVVGKGAPHPTLTSADVPEETKEAMKTWCKMHSNLRYSEDEYEENWYEDNPDAAAEDDVVPFPALVRDFMGATAAYVDPDTGALRVNTDDDFVEMTPEEMLAFEPFGITDDDW